MPTCIQPRGGPPATPSSFQDLLRWVCIELTLRIIYPRLSLQRAHLHPAARGRGAACNSFQLPPPRLRPGRVELEQLVGVGACATHRHCTENCANDARIRGML